MVAMATAEATPGKQRLTKNSAPSGTPLQACLSKVQQFRVETDHVTFSESKAFPWVLEDLNLGPHACSYSLSLFLNPMCILQDSCRLQLTANLCKIYKSYRKPGFPRANWACNREGDYTSLRKGASQAARPSLFSDTLNLQNIVCSLLIAFTQALTVNGKVQLLRRTLGSLRLFPVYLIPADVIPLLTGVS